MSCRYRSETWCPTSGFERSLISSFLQHAVTSGSSVHRISAHKAPGHRNSPVAPRARLGFVVGHSFEGSKPRKSSCSVVLGLIPQRSQSSLPDSVQAAASMQIPRWRAHRASSIQTADAFQRSPLPSQRDLRRAFVPIPSRFSELHSSLGTRPACSEVLGHPFRMSFCSSAHLTIIYTCYKQSLAGRRKLVALAG